MNTSGNSAAASGRLRYEPEVWPLPRDLADVNVRFMPVVHDPGVSGRCRASLSPSEQARAERFASPVDRDEFVQRRAFQRLCGAEALGQSRPPSAIVFEHDDKGRPYLADRPHTWFSFASCRDGMIGAWSEQAAVGVDIERPSERVRPEAEALAAGFFTEREQRAIAAANEADRLRLFYRFWCLKEAALKSIGEGLPYGMKQFEFDLTTRARVLRSPGSFGGARNFLAYERSASSMHAAVIRRRL